MRRPRILFVEQFYYPEGWGGAELPRDLTIHLAQHGFDVDVICGSDQYSAIDGDPGPDPEELGVRIHRVKRLLNGRIHRRKLLRQLWFYCGLLPQLLFRPAPDIYVTQTNPPLVVVLVAAVAFLRRRPLIIIAMDIYPEVMNADGVIAASGVISRLLTAVFRWSYRRARHVVSLGPVMSERLEAKGVDAKTIVEIPTWATGSPGVVRGRDNALRVQWQLVDRNVLLYSGNLGIAHEFDVLLKAVSGASQRMPALRLVFIGQGRRLEEVQRQVNELQLAHIVQFHGFVPSSRLPESLGIADMAIVTLRRGFEGLVVPSKLQGYMARGIPVLYIGPRSDSSLHIQRSEGGCCMVDAEAREVADTIVELFADRAALQDMGRRARRYYTVEFSREEGLRRFEAMLQSVVGKA